MAELGVCGNFRPYAQAERTFSLGCVNCGYPAYSHDNICSECSGAGRAEKPDHHADNDKPCPKCGGSGRSDGTFWSGI